MIWHNKLHHLILWMLVWITWYFLRYQDYTPQQAVVVTTIKTIDLALMVYFANYILVPQLLYKKRYVWFVIADLALILSSSIIKMYVIASYLDTDLSDGTIGIKERFYNNVVPHFFLVTAGVAVKLMVDFLQLQTRLAEVAKERAESELNFLKSQINPHFLFNSLNSVFFLIDKNNVEAREALHKFSDMLRYQLYEVKGEKIPIEKEIGYLQDYIGLQRLRRDDNFDIQLNIQDGLPVFYIEPLILVPFVENSFKHLSHYDTILNQVHIRISKQNGTMNFTVRNTTDGKQMKPVAGTGGIGLENVKRRLELLYPGQHILNIENDNGWFDVNLQIKIDN